MPKFADNGNIVKNLYKTYQEIGKEGVTVNELMANNDILNNYFIGRTLGALLRSLEWVVIGKTMTPTVNSRTNLSIWKPPGE